MGEFSAWLDAAAARTFVLCATLFVAMNAGAVAMVLKKRDRALVNRWTGRWLAANLALLGAGLGVPLAAKVVHITVEVLSGSPPLPVSSEQELEREKGPARPQR